MLVIKEPVLSGEITDATIPVHLGCTLAYNAAIRLLCTRPVLRRCAYSNFTTNTIHKATAPRPANVEWVQIPKFVGKRRNRAETRTAGNIKMDRKGGRGFRELCCF